MNLDGFVKGAKVRCIDEEAHGIRLNNTYKIIELTDDCIFIKNDLGILEYYKKHRFELADKPEDKYNAEMLVKDEDLKIDCFTATHIITRFAEIQIEIEKLIDKHYKELLAEFEELADKSEGKQKNEGVNRDEFEPTKTYLMAHKGEYIVRLENNSILEINEYNEDLWYEHLNHTHESFSPITKIYKLVPVWERQDTAEVERLEKQIADLQAQLSKAKGEMK